MRGKKISELIRAARRLTALANSQDRELEQLHFLEDEAIHELKRRHEIALQTTHSTSFAPLRLEQINQLTALYKTHINNRLLLKQRFTYELTMLAAANE